MDIGKKISKLRIKNKDTLKGLAARIDFDWSNLSKIEKGTREAPLNLLFKLCEVYDVNLTYFLDGLTESEVKLLKEDDLNQDSIEEKYNFVEPDGSPVSKDEIKDALALLRYLKQLG